MQRTLENTINPMGTVALLEERCAFMAQVVEGGRTSSKELRAASVRTRRLATESTASRRTHPAALVVSWRNSARRVRGRDGLAVRGCTLAQIARTSHACMSLRWDDVVVASLLLAWYLTAPGR